MSIFGGRAANTRNLISNRLSTYLFCFKGVNFANMEHGVVVWGRTNRISSTVCWGTCKLPLCLKLRKRRNCRTSELPHTYYTETTYSYDILEDDGQETIYEPLTLFKNDVLDIFRCQIIQTDVSLLADHNKD